jgi:TIR domain
MPGIKLQKRENNFFISYGHSGLARVLPLIDLLKRACGLKIWFDSIDGNASERSSALLAGAIGNSRGAIFCLSEAWKQSSWCKGEYDVSLSEQRTHDGFEIVSLRLDDVEPPGWFNVAEIIDLRQLTAQSFARLLRSLSSDIPHRVDNAEDVYLAAAWTRQSALGRETLETVGRGGWRLVGDNPNLKYLGEKRIAAIQRTCRGVVAILPHDPTQLGAATSPWIVQEARLALELKKPLLLLAEPGVVLEQDLLQAAFRGSAVTLAAGPESRAALAGVLDDFDEELRHVTHDDTGAFIFFAASLLGDPSEADDVASVIERSSNMRCVRGERLSGANVQAAIIDLIQRAAVVIADVSDDHRNTLIEAGVAMGSGTELKFICRAPPDGVFPKKPFMFEGREFFWYHKPEERLGLCCSFAREFRRRVYVTR